MKKLFFLLLSLVFVFTLTAQKKVAPAPAAPAPKNVILLIGDGMGVAQVYSLIATRDNTAFEQFKHLGYSKTSSANKFTTDSGAGGSALATGFKNNNNSISIDPQTQAPLKSLTEYSHEKGLLTGLVTTCAITHATPAAFFAHNIHRDNYEDIAEDMLKGHINLFFGGGRVHFEKRKDGRNLSDSLRQRGYQVLYSPQDIARATGTKVAGMLFEKHPVSMVDGRGNYLPTATAKALELLSAPGQGFFLMIEGSQIDWACHDNRYETMVEEVSDFEQAIRAALDFAQKDGHTLVIVTADHETGGLSVPSKEKNDGSLLGRYSTYDHSSLMVPVFAYGPGAELFGGIYENTEIQKKIRSLLAL